MGFRDKDLRCRVEGSRVWNLGIGVWGGGFRHCLVLIIEILQVLGLIEGVVTTCDPAVGYQWGHMVDPTDILKESRLISNQESLGIPLCG